MRSERTKKTKDRRALRAILNPPVSVTAESVEDTSAQRRREVRAEQVRLLYANGNTAVAVTVLVSSALAYLQWAVIPHWIVLSWLAYMHLEAWAVFALGWRYRRTSPVLSQMDQWRVAFIAGAGLSAAGWGVAAIVLYPEAQLTNQILLAFVLGGMMLGAGSILAARAEAFVAFLVPVGFPTALRFVLERDNLHLVMGLLGALFTVATLITTWHIYQAVGSSLMLRFENHDLLRDLQMAQQRLEALNQDLELRVQQRTAELDQVVTHLKEEIVQRQRAEEERASMESSLRHTQKLDAIGVLAGGIAHDFNNLLTSIAGYATLVRDSLPKDAEASDHLEEVLKASTRAGSLVRRLLVFGRRSEHKPDLVPVAEVVTEALELVRASIPSSISFRQSIHPECGYIFADPNLIQQVVLNLCTNAYEAMAGKAGQLEVTLAPVEVSPAATVSGLPNGPYVRLTVRDTGPGIPSEIAERVFEPFFTTKPAGKGTGLGLSVIHGIVTTYGGLVTFENRPPKGATFLVFLPRLPAKEQVRAEVPEVAASTQRILLVDDEESIARLGALMLRRLGHVVTSTTSSVKALRVFMKEPYSFDLVISDLTMPQMTGKELIRRLKQIRPDIPVVLMSGFNDASVTAGEAETIGIGEFLGKPFSRFSLTDAIRRVLQKKADSRNTG